MPYRARLARCTVTALTVARTGLAITRGYRRGMVPALPLSMANNTKTNTATATPNTAPTTAPTAPTNAAPTCPKGIAAAKWALACNAVANVLRAPKGCTYAKGTHYPLAATLQVLVGANPKRPGTRAHALWACAQAAVAKHGKASATGGTVGLVAYVYAMQAAGFGSHIGPEVQYNVSYRTKTGGKYWAMLPL